jgi:hypothetical protein
MARLLVRRTISSAGFSKAIGGGGSPGRTRLRSQSLLAGKILGKRGGRGSRTAVGPAVSSAGPTLCFDHLTPAQVRAFRIADNRLTEISVRDGRLLAEQLKELLLLGLDFNIEAAGFDKGEIGFRIASLEGPSEADDELAFAAPAPCSLCLDRHCARRCVKRQVGTKGWSLSIKGTSL